MCARARLSWPAHSGLGLVDFQGQHTGNAYCDHSPHGCRVWPQKVCSPVGPGSSKKLKSLGYGDMSRKLSVHKCFVTHMVPMCGTGKNVCTGKRTCHPRMEKPNIYSPNAPCNPLPSYHKPKESAEMLLTPASIFKQGTVPLLFPKSCAAHTIKRWKEKNTFQHPETKMSLIFSGIFVSFYLQRAILQRALCTAGTTRRCRRTDPGCGSGPSSSSFQPVTSVGKSS